MFPILHKVWHSLLSIMKHIKALIIDGSYSIWILTFCFGQPMWRSFCCATLHQKRRKWHTAMVMAIVDCDITKLSVWLLCVTWPVSFYADRNSVDVDAPGERVGALQGHLYERCCLKQEYFTHGSIGWIYIPWWWLATEHGLSSGLLLNRRYCNGFWLVKPVVLERFYHANWPL